MRHDASRCDMVKAKNGGGQKMHANTHEAQKNAERQTNGFFFAKCPGCRIIFSMKNAEEQEVIEKKGCSICRYMKREVKQ